MHTLLEHRVAGLALLSPLMPTKELRGLTHSWPTVLVGRDTSIAGVDVVTTDELHAALRSADACKSFVIIEVMIDPHDLSPVSRKYIAASASKGHKARR